MKVFPPLPGCGESGPKISVSRLLVTESVETVEARFKMVELGYCTTPPDKRAGLDAADLCACGQSLPAGQSDCCVACVLCPW